MPSSTRISQGRAQGRREFPRPDRQVAFGMRDRGESGDIVRKGNVFRRSFEFWSVAFRESA